ncbi:serine protease htra related protein [Pyrococcus sp. NA2]|nr:serine protease htra related protein [Pyrococcus sp. NA2]
MATLLYAILAIVGFWLIIGLIGETLLKGRESIEIAPFQIVWRTKKFLNFIDRVGQRHRKFWKIYGDLGIVVGFGGMGFILYYFAKQAYKIISPVEKIQMPSVQLVIPGVTIPLIYGLIGLTVLIIVHELSHGFVARAENIPLKSVGLLLFIILPGAFVEPDEDLLKKAPLRTRLRIFGAGSFANMIVALISLLIINGIALAFEPQGVEIRGVIEGSPAYGVLNPGDVIVGINGEPIKTLEEFMNFMNKTKPGDKITLTILRENKIVNITLILGQHPKIPGKGFIGIYPTQNFVSKIGFKDGLMVLFSTFYWIYVLNFGVGLMNLLPVIPLDGGRMLIDTLTEASPKFGRLLGYSIMILSLILLGINLIPAIRGFVG